MNDTFTVDSGYPTCGDFGTIVGTPTVTATGGSFQCNFPDGPNTTDVAIKVTDSDGGSDTASKAVQIVQVANVDPTITAPADQSSNEGDSHSFDLGTFSDPGTDSPWQVSVDWGDSSPVDTYSITGSGAASDVAIGPRSHTYADGPNDYTVSVTVTDKNGGSDTKTFSVHVNNVAPTIAISGTANVDEGSRLRSHPRHRRPSGQTHVGSSYVVRLGRRQHRHLHLERRLDQRLPDRHQLHRQRQLHGAGADHRQATTASPPTPPPSPSTTSRRLLI